MLIRRLCASAAAAFALLAVIVPAQAQDYPNRAIRLVVGFAPGGNTDFVARIVADKVRAQLGQTVVIENKPGANGAIAAEAVAKSPPDGYTLFFTSVGAVAINPGFRKDLTYDSLKDFAPIGLMTRAAPVLVVRPAMGVNSAAELVTRAKQNPGTITVGITGIGAISHLGLELFEAAAGVKFIHVPYRGSGPALADLLGGQVNAIIIDVAVMLEHIKAGSIKVLASTAAQRSEQLPQIPTFVEQGYADAIADNWTGLLAPAGTPPAIIAKLNGAVTRALNEPETRRKIEESGLIVSPSSPAEFADILKSEIERWDRVIREKGIKSE
jgi:tripartite-type tricarboxylate transporter receptor subunit TctC